MRPKSNVHILLVGVPYKRLCSKTPAAVYMLFEPSTRSARLIMPKFKKEFYKSKSFVYNSSKIFNILLLKNTNCSSISLETFKINTKRLLIAIQNVSLKNDPNWLPNNFSIFSISRCVEMFVSQKYCIVFL